MSLLFIFVAVCISKSADVEAYSIRLGEARSFCPSKKALRIKIEEKFEQYAVQRGKIGGVYMVKKTKSLQSFFFRRVNPSGAV